MQSASWQWWCGLAASLWAGAALATFHTFQISEIFSNADGTVQFVELQEAFGADGQHLLAGHTLVASGGGASRSFTFPNNLPSSSTAGRNVLIATQGFAALGRVTPNYVVPDGFLALTAGSVNFAGVDTVSYAALPVDGSTSIDRAGVPQANTPRNFSGQSASLTSTGYVIEFHNTGLDHFFVTADGVEAASIDAGGSGPGWVRTGNSFRSGGPNAVCRFYGVQSAGGPNGHFYTADAAECDQVRLDPGWHFESLDFVITPAVDRACPAGLRPVYRAYNNRFAQHDSNHRLTTNLTAYQQQVAAGWVGEGIVMCAQP